MTELNINGIPALIWGKPSDLLYIAIHGKTSSKENFRDFAAIAEDMGYQVLSFDLPEHGERSALPDACNPWNGVRDCSLVLDYAKSHWTDINLYAESLGAYFGLLAYKSILFRKCLFVSPVLDMKMLIENMMSLCGVSEEKLKTEKEIKTSFGETLSWEYFNYTKQHPITRWDSPTAILYAENDNLTNRATIDCFISRFGSTLTVMENGEHWFHTPAQLLFLNSWLTQNI